MSTKNEKVKALEVSPAELERELAAALEEGMDRPLEELYDESVVNFEEGNILTGRILNVLSDDVVVDVGYKSEGIVPLREFSGSDEVEVGSVVEVLLEGVDDSTGLVLLSKRRAERLRGWQRIIAECNEGDVINGQVMKKIKGGLLVDIGVPAFLPASQVDLRRPDNIEDYVGQTIECKVLKIDTARHNIVVSRRQLLEEERAQQKEKLMQEIAIAQVRKGVVKNIADFGAFVDLGGIDGLLHITDMSWGRVNHPSEIVALDEEIEVVILGINREEDKISLGLKQKTESPWANVEEKYPVGSMVRGQVVNIVPYGAFVKLEEGIEGLVHISEMSWTRRINHPTEVAAIGDTVEVVVLGINQEKEEIALSIKQTEVNPWELVEQKYPPGTIIEGRVRNLTNYGAFIEIEEGVDGLLHISDMSWTRKIGHPSDVVKKAEKIKCLVLSVDPQRKRVALGMRQLEEDPWLVFIPEKYLPGEIVKGKATKITNFGVFVELEDGVEGLLHISELADYKVESPEEIVSTGQELRVKILRVDPINRKIGLSLKRVTESEAQTGVASAQEPTQPAPQEEAPPTAEAEDASEAAPESLEAPPAEPEAAETEVAEPGSEKPEAAEAEPRESDTTEAESTQAGEARNEGEEGPAPDTSTEMSETEGPDADQPQEEQQP